MDKHHLAIQRLASMLMLLGTLASILEYTGIYDATGSLGWQFGVSMGGLLYFAVVISRILPSLIRNRNQEYEKPFTLEQEHILDRIEIVDSTTIRVSERDSINTRCINVDNVDGLKKFCEFLTENGDVRKHS